MSRRLLRKFQNLIEKNGEEVGTCNINHDLADEIQFDLTLDIGEDYLRSLLIRLDNTMSIKRAYISTDCISDVDWEMYYRKSFKVA